MVKLLVYLSVGLSIAGCTRSTPQLPENKTGKTSIPYSAHPKLEDSGFIYSPFAPDMGYIDVRGLKAGSEVCDPYTGKIFRLHRDYSHIKGPGPAPKPEFQLYPIEGHPGFYRMSGEEMQGQLDLRTLPAGVEMRSPYRGDIYVVPPYHIQQKVR